jgi:lipopolysaccharide export system permease protein
MMRWLFPSKTLGFYVAKMFLGRFIAFLALLVLILQGLDLLTEKDKILAVAGNGNLEVLAYLKLRLPQLLSKFAPFAVLLATLLTMMTLNQNSEVVIMKATGLSAHQILRPLFAASLLVAAGQFIFNEHILMPANAKLEAWKKSDYGAKPAELAKGSREVWITDGDATAPDIIHARNIERKKIGLVMTDLTLYQRHAQDSPVVITRADSAILTNGLWQLRGITRTDVSQLTTTKTAATVWHTTIPAERFMAVAVAPDKTRFGELRHAVQELSAAGRPVDSLRAGLHHKISGPLSAVLMPLLGAVAAFGIARSGKLFVRAVIGLALGFAYFVADNALLAMGQFGAIPAVLAAWAPFLLFFLLGESVLLRSEE